MGDTDLPCGEDHSCRRRIDVADSNLVVVVVVAAVAVADVGVAVVAVAGCG